MASRSWENLLTNIVNKSDIREITGNINSLQKFSGNRTEFAVLHKDNGTFY